ncbi:thiol-activated cytolysin family protein [Maribacter aestuarii]|uniref:thiol-activated cytolysin family protein n=1 Tax=Maribacter aestuarii TaxID=1130723 RepID=UPI00248C4131|nr:thiol-activated cytolysin family protein [Maribacter aestuarii]
MKTSIQQKQSRILSYLILGIAVLTTISCTKDEVNTVTDPISGGEATEFNEKVAELQFFQQSTELSEPQELEASEPERDTEDIALECFTKTFKAAPGYDEMLALDPSTDVIFPGALLKGESIPTGEYIPITTNRAPITLSASLTNISGSPVVSVSDPKLSTVRQEIKTILDQEVTGATPARINFEIQQVYSSEQLSVAIGANYRSAGTSVSGAFDFNQSTLKNKFVLKYLQTYYTIDMDPPNNPSDLFTSVPDFNSLGSTSPVYVASVAYGRMVLYTIETNASQTEINAAFSASFASADGSIDTEYEKTINESNIKALIIGGSGSDAAQAINGPADVYKFIAEGGDYSKDSPGAPLAYKLRYIKKGTPVARVVLTSEYPIRTCDLAYPIFRISINSLRIADTPGGLEGSHLEVYGIVKGKINTSSKEVKWSRSKSNNLRFTGLHNVNQAIEIELYRPNYDVDYVELSGSLTDEDTTSDDFLGSRSSRVMLKDLVPAAAVTGVQLRFDEKPQHDVRANFSVSRIK